MPRAKLSDVQPVTPAHSGRAKLSDVTAVPADTRNAVQKEFDEVTQPEPYSANAGILGNAGRAFRNLGGGLVSLASPLVHPVETGKTALGLLGQGFGAPNKFTEPAEESLAAPLIKNEGETGGQYAGRLGGEATSLLGSAVGAEGARLIPEAARAVRSAAIGDPDVAAIRAAGVPKKAALGFKSDVQGARPYLRGAQSVKDVQDTAGLGGTARNEIYKPISDFLSEHGGRVVQGPDGPTTLNDLENERGQVSAQLRQLRAGGPEGIALATQKGLNQADLLARQSAIENAMDPHLMGAGIDSPLIRQTYGQVARVGDTFAGRLTAAEKPSPYGLGRMLNMRIDNPRSWLGAPAQGARDLLAGRPLWSGNAGDVGVSEAFRSGPPKPDFRAPVSAMPPWENAPRLLESDVPGNAPYGEEPYPGSMNGIPERNPVRIGPEPVQRPLLPASTSAGEPQPMLRYATPYVEPYDPGLKPFSPAEYLKPAQPFPARPVQRPLVTPQEPQ